MGRYYNLRHDAPAKEFSSAEEADAYKAKGAWIITKKLPGEKEKFHRGSPQNDQNYWQPVWEKLCEVHNISYEKSADQLASEIKFPAGEREKEVKDSVCCIIG